MPWAAPGAGGPAGAAHDVHLGSKWPTAIQDPRGYVFTYQYQSLAADANLRQLQAVVLPEGGRFTYQLDASDNLVAVIDERGYRTSMTYAGAGWPRFRTPSGQKTEPIEKLFGSLVLNTVPSSFLGQEVWSDAKHRRLRGDLHRSARTAIAGFSRLVSRRRLSRGVSMVVLKQAAEALSLSLLAILRRTPASISRRQAASIGKMRAEQY